MYPHRPTGIQSDGLSKGVDRRVVVLSDGRQIADRTPITRHVVETTGDGVQRFPRTIGVPRLPVIVGQQQGGLESVRSLVSQFRKLTDDLDGGQRSTGEGFVHSDRLAAAALTLQFAAKQFQGRATFVVTPAERPQRMHRVQLIDVVADRRLETLAGFVELAHRQMDVGQDGVAGGGPFAVQCGRCVA